MHKKNIVIYGATGSIGESALNLIRDNKENFNVVGLTCNENINKVIKIANEFDCKNIGIANKELIIQNKFLLKNYTIFAGIEEFQYMAIDQSVDIIIFAISGSTPLKLLMEISSSGKTIGLANKECIISLGNLFLDKAEMSKTKIIPLDSEHNAIYQLIKNKNIDSINKYIITASGGNFYQYKYADLMNITPEQAITHPKWKMGKKITIDSSTLMNKGLEIIEACILFNIVPSKIDALIHPESIIHGLVEFKDSSVHAFLSQPNMEVSISSILFDNNNIDLNQHKLDLSFIGSLHFIKIDNDKFKAIELAKNSLDYGGLCPAVLNYTNELMVNFFLDKKISFTDIVNNNKKVMEQFISENNNTQNPNIEDINQSFATVDEYASRLISN
jgi:1-deoxy-D-xylulose-5-phosphate reductoisomerase